MRKKVCLTVGIDFEKVKGQLFIMMSNVEYPPCTYESIANEVMAFIENPTRTYIIMITVVRI